MDNYLRVTYSKKYCVVFLSKISLYLFILLGMACNESANKSHVFEKEQDQYIAQTEDYQITLANNAIEILPSGAQATTTIAFAQEKKNEPIISSQKAIYKNAFEQTDIVLYKKENGDLAYDIELAPHATVEEVKLKLDNIENAYISSSGELIIPIDGGAIHHSAPVSYQEIEGERIAVESAFTLSDATLGFEVGDYDPNYSLVIDPTISFVLAVTINVFEDYDNDGVDDGAGEPGVAGVTVTAFDDAGTATVLTDNGDGSYTLPGSGGPFRIEVTNIPFYLEPGAAGTTTTFFVNDGESADVALIDPKEFCADDTRIAVPCYVDGERNSIPNSVQDAVITFDINSGGAPGSNSIATYTASTNKFIEADLREIGATYGVAYQRQTSTLFMASMLKRHVDLGPDGIGAIYRTSLNSSSPSLFIDLEALGLDVGTDPRTGTTDFDEDYDAFPLVSKASFGDMDMGSDDETLWVMDLFNRQLLEIPIGPTGQAPTMLSQIGQYPVPDPGCAANGDVRPFAIEVHRGVVYVGLVCSGESTGDIADLQAHIYSFDPISKTYSTNPVFSITDLTYERGCSVTVAETACDVDMDPTRNPGQERRSAGWFTWIDDPDDFPKRGGDVGYGVPILADIEFNEDNDLILGFRDRSGDQAGWEIRHPDPNFLTGNINIALEAQGDILRAEFDGVSSWTLESNAMSGGVTTSGQNNDEGPGGGEFFVVDGSNRTYLNTNGSNTNPGHEESSHGALALKMGTQNVIFTQMNPVPLEGGSVNPNVNRDGGIRTANTEDGTLVRAFRVFDGDNNEDDFFDKGAGLGDLELVGEAAPLQVGNYIWEDTDGDGIQDPSESGIAGVTVELWADTDGDGIADTKVAETTTDANGQYLFSEAGTNAYGQNEDWSFFNGDDDEVDYNTAYEIRIPTAQSALTDLNITTQNTGGVADNNNLSDLSDSDAMEDGANAVIAFTTGGPGENNPTLDAGFRPEQPLGSIGNYVWIDEDSDGFQDEGEVGIPNVAVVLKDGNGNPIDTTYTDSDGGYLFTDLSAGDYFVDVLDGEDGTTNTLPNSALSQTTINTNVVDGSDADTVDDDGDLGNKDHSGNGYAITLDPGEENLTADFGYNYNPTADVNDPSTGADNTAALGDRVWIDSDGDGVQDPNEVGVSGVQITLTCAGPDGIFGTADDITATTTTDENGYYLFDNLTPGAYTTEVTSSDPAVTGVPVSHDILNTTNYAQTGDPDDFGDLATMPDNQQTQPIVLGPGDVYLNSDYGYQPTAANMELGS
ncbi:MAG: SdrD B-like domain-containing protein, partial [Bacteroidota bacterium]